MGAFFGTISKGECGADLYYGTDYNSHLGTRRAGMATYDENRGFLRGIHSLENSYFRNCFEDELDKFTGKSGIGIISDTDAQPMLVNSHLGRFALVTVARINNAEALAKKLLDEGMYLTEFSSGKINVTELISLLIVRGKDFVEGIENVYREVKGSCSMLILTEDGIIAARDTWGRTPIAIGQKDGAMAVSSESTAFANLGYKTCGFVGPGEIVRLRADGMEQLRKPNPHKQVCSFLWIYYGFPTSCYDGRNVEESRFACGKAMAKADAAEGGVDADCVCGIPDSGIGMAVGYAAGSNVPYMRTIAKYTPTWSRSFMPSSQTTRNLVAKMKLIDNEDMLRDKSILFCDDSIVRGTQLRDNTRQLHENGAKEVHMRIACPPLVFGCPFLNFSASKTEYELITRRIIKEFEGEDCKDVSKYTDSKTPEYSRMTDEIARQLSLDSLKFNTIEDLVESIGLPREDLCLHCFDGSSAYTLEEENK
ncbi:MAG: amidophosphoribosyltransferase [Bacteroidales bacterium]|nr:amidophosphoribosyltransferase [Bacteroidales bacterium]